MNKLLGLIGFPLGHSFSRRYFTDKFQNLSLNDWNYQNFPIEDISQIQDILLTNPNLVGFNVTIPHKVAIIPFLSEIDDSAKKIGAVNCVQILQNSKLKGYNTDYIGFKTSLIDMIGDERPKALVLGTGGASKAVITALEDISIEYTIISRYSGDNKISYDELNNNIISSHKLIINTTPLGMSPIIEGIPEINYDMISDKHYMFDLIFNPAETKFMFEGRIRGATVKNGYQMLTGQAEAWWDIISELKNV